MNNIENAEFWRILGSICNDIEHFKEKMTTTRYDLQEYLEVKYDLNEQDSNWLSKCLIKHEPTLENYL